jgi:hypothetical protein
MLATRQRHFLIACLWALTLSIVTACGGGGDEGSNGPIAQISINSTGGSTSATSVTVSGTAQMDNLAAPLSEAPITWSAGSNSGVADRSIVNNFGIWLSYSWSATIPLEFGDNTITVSFLDASQSIVITRFTQVKLAGTVTMATTAAVVPGVMVSLDRPPTPGGISLKETDINGTFLFPEVRVGSYILAPAAPAPPQSSSCFSYDPVETTINVGATDTADKQADFIATPLFPCYSISGQVVPNTNPTFGLQDVTVTLTDSSGNALVRTTNLEGIYLFYQLPPGTYTVTPSNFNGKPFNPVSMTVTITNFNINLPTFQWLF